MRTSGFSIAEFVISITIMLIVSVSVLPMLLKKAKKPSNPVRMVGEYTCTDNICEFNTENMDVKDKEFITIDLVGGGAAGSTNSNNNGSKKGRGGGAGQLKTIHLPAMNGTYRIYTGNPGKINNNKTKAGSNGGDTILVKVVGNNEQIIEYARGGISNNEITNNADEQKGEDSPMTIGNTLVGKGGDYNKNGTRGGAIIKW